MRFGESLLAYRKAEWRTYYLHYNTLKTLLNDIVRDKAAARAESHDDLASFVRFRALLDADIAALQAFIVKVKEFNAIDEEMLERKLQVMTADLAELRRQDDELKVFIKINQRGIRKLLKKHDKLTRGQPALQDEYLAEWARWRKLPFHIPVAYNAFLIDMDGVLYHGNHLLPGVPEFVDWLRRNNKQYLFLTNSSDKTPEMIAQKLGRLGIPNVAKTDVYTSAIATARFLWQQQQTKHRRYEAVMMRGASSSSLVEYSTDEADAERVPPTRVYAIGEVGLLDALKEYDCVLVDEDPEYVVIGETTHFDYTSITKAINFIKSGSKLIGTNVDHVDRVEGGKIAPSCGSLVGLIQVSTGVAPYFAGKPNSLMFRGGLDTLRADRRTTLMLGDRMDTDVVGAMESGIDTLLVLSGVVKREDLARYSFSPTYILDGVDELVEVICANTPSDVTLISEEGGGKGGNADGNAIRDE